MVQSIDTFYLAVASEETPQERQCTYNFILRRVGATIVAVEQQEVLHVLSVCL
jgi:hypothetical protein